MDCLGCEHFYYNSDGSGACDAPYEHACLRAHHYFHSHPAEFAEKYLGIKLYPWQKILLEGVENLNARTASRYISRK